jgi:hypothetical protein
VKRFEIGDKLDGFVYEVRVYPTRAAYLRAYRGFRPRDRTRADSHAATVHFRLTDSADGTEDDAKVGMILVHEAILDAEIVSHEATHAALNLWRRRHGSGDLGMNRRRADVEREEELALSIGRLSQAIADSLWELGCWTRPDGRGVEKG